MRSSAICYNRSNFSFSEILPAMVNWDSALENCNWFYQTGITPALSKGAFDTLKEGLALARKKGLNVSADPTYRSGLWKYDQDSKATLIELLHLSTVLLKVISQYVL